MTIFEVLLWSVNMTGWVTSASSEMSAYGPLTPDSDRLLVYLRQILHRRYLLGRAGPPLPDW
jgi:hypothetical protein